MKGFGLLCATLVALATSAGSARAGGGGVIHGTVARDGARETVVYVDSIPAKVELKLAKSSHSGVWVAQRRSGFVPSLRIVVQGDTVRFLNRDRHYHNVFGVGPGVKFDLGRYASGQSLSTRFEHLGVVRLFCELHPAEAGTVFVVPNHAFARPDARGSFALPRLPPGHYSLRIWNARLGEQGREVEIPHRGDAEIAIRS